MLSQEILDSVLQLPEAERLFIASRILETLPDEVAVEALNEDEFAAELERRSGDWQGTVPWPELRASLQSKK
jgi:hypothetical protein